MRREEYIVYSFKYKDINYRIVGDEFNFSSLKLEREIFVSGEELYVEEEDENIKNFGYKQIMKEHEKTTINTQELGYFVAYLDKKEEKITPENVEEKYEKMMQEYNLPSLIFGYIPYPDVGAFRLYVRGDGYKGIKYIASIKNNELEKAYKYLFFSEALYLFNIFSSKQESKIVEKGFSFDIDEYRGARGKLKYYLNILADAANLISEKAFLFSITKKADEFDDKEMLKAKEYFLRMDLEEVKAIKNELEISG